jgi:hypothetical protein
MLGSSEISQFTDPDRMDELMRQFLARSQLSQLPATTTSASIALVLLQGAG